MKITNTFIYHIFSYLLQLPIWWFSKFHKRDPNLWVFGAWYGKNFSDNAKAVFEYVTEYRPNINAVWITGNKDVFNYLLSKRHKVYLKGTRKAKKTCLNAGFVFLTIDVNDVERSYINGAKQVWLWHGMPLKKIGFDKKNNYSLKERITRLFPQNNNNKPDYFISTSIEWDSVLKTAFHINKKNIIITGLPRNDLFYNNNTEHLISEIDSNFNHPLKILYMPTFRDVNTLKGEVFNPFRHFGFDNGIFKNFLETNNIVFIYKGHNFDLWSNDKHILGYNRYIVLNDQMYSDMYSFIKDTDILITDYSSIYFDYLLLKKPIILAPFDKDEYCSKSRPLYFDYDMTFDGIKAYNWNDVIDIIVNKKYYVPSQQTLNRFHLFQDGCSSQRVTDYILSISDY